MVEKWLYMRPIVRKIIFYLSKYRFIKDYENNITVVCWQ